MISRSVIIFRFGVSFRIKSALALMPGLVMTPLGGFCIQSVIHVENIGDLF